MTLRLHKKRQITVPTYNRATLLKPAAFLLLTVALAATGQAQTWRSPVRSNAGHQPAPQMRKVPTAATTPAQTTTQNPRPAGWDLNWRQSTKIQRVPKSSTDVFADSPVKPAGGTTATAIEPNPVRAAAWNEESEPSGNDFFDNPFGRVAQVAQQAPTFQDAPAAPPAPSAGTPQNNLRSSGPGDGFAFPPGDIGTAEPLPAPLREPTPAATPTPNNPAPANPLQNAVPETESPSKLDALRDMLEREEAPTPPEPRMELSPEPDAEGTDESPSDVEEFGNPFPNRDLDAEDVRKLNDRTLQQRERTKDSGFSLDETDEMKKVSSGISCEDFRQRIAQQSITSVSLDISPPYRPDVLRENEFQKLKQEFDEKQPFREWRSIDGRVLSAGRLRDLAYEKVVIETDQGSLIELAINKLSEADLAYVSENWQLPKECLLAQTPRKNRNWAPMTMTWKASNLCHKPLYFEDVNLERYGHTRGPILEPVVQSAHFFANIAILPYKMGVHAPHECQYALGYYRPGSCAPWIKDPFPLSARGAIAQGAAVTGLFWLVP